jgi:NAD(P)-dependent dehydrogenase (short-subunit alcohol dehydrogenase family)
MSSNDLLAIVTGTSSGLGAAIARILLAQDWTVVGLSRRRPDLASPGYRHIEIDLGALEQADPLQVASVFAVNLIAPIFLTGFVVRTAPPPSPLRIVNVSTGAAVQAIPGIGDYGSSKAALRLASMTFAAELASSERPGGARPHTSILSYAPGVVDTSMQESARTDRPWNRLFVDFHAQGKLVPADAPAREVVEFLSGDGNEPFLERRFGENKSG